MPGLSTALGVGRGGINYSNSRQKGLNKKQSTEVGVAAGAPTIVGFTAGDKIHKAGIAGMKKAAGSRKLSLGDKAVAGHLGKMYGVETAGLAVGGLAARGLQKHIIKNRRSQHQGVTTTHDQHWNNTQTSW